MSKYVVIITIVIVGLVGSGTAVALDGSGTEQDPWRIQSLEDFNEFAADANYWAGYTRLETDVNLVERTYSTAVIAPDVSSVEYLFQGTAFIGVFDGNDHKIIGLTIDDGGADNWYLGLFGYIDEGEVKNLGVEGGFVSGWYFVGGLVGENDGSVSNCYSTGFVSGYRRVGGLVGYSEGSILDCHSIGPVSGTDYVGGLVGRNYYGTISNCYSTGNVSAIGNEVGGLVGANLGSVSNCYATGDVNGVAHVGGLVGRNGFWFIEPHPGYIYNSYSTSAVEGGVLGVGGLVGYNELGDIEMSYWDIETSNEPNMCCYQNPNATGCDPNYGKRTAEMHQQSTFQDWDFINVWNIGENQTYPYLRVFLAADLNKDGIVNFLDFAIAANKWLEEDKTDE